MQTQAAVLWDYGRDWEIEELTLDDPREGEVLVRLAASGLCHSDEHLRIGDLPMESLPAIGGHEGAGTQVGLQQDGTARHHVGGHDARLMCQIGTFSPYTVVNEDSVGKIDDDIPRDKAALVTVDVTNGKVISDAVSVVGKGGKVALTALAPYNLTDVQLPVLELIVYEKRLIGCLFGHSNPRSDVPKMLQLYRDGKLLLDELVTRTYTLDQINEGYEAMRTHNNIRGMLLYD